MNHKIDVDLVVRFRVGPGELPALTTMTRRVLMAVPPAAGMHVTADEPFTHFRVDAVSYDVRTEILTAFHYQKAVDEAHLSRLREVWALDGFDPVIGDDE